MTNEFLFFMLQNFSFLPNLPFLRDREVHLQYCSSPWSFWFFPDVTCLVSWLSCLFITTPLLSHFHFPICTQHSRPASLQNCAPKTCFLTMTSPLPTAFGLGEGKSQVLFRPSGEQLEQFPLTAAHDLSAKILH